MAPVAVRAGKNEQWVQDMWRSVSNPRAQAVTRWDHSAHRLAPPSRGQTAVPSSLPLSITQQGDDSFFSSLSFYKGHPNSVSRPRFLRTLCWVPQVVPSCVLAQEKGLGRGNGGNPFPKGGGLRGFRSPGCWRAEQSCGHFHHVHLGLVLSPSLNCNMSFSILFLLFQNLPQLEDTFIFSYQKKRQEE